MMRTMGSKAKAAQIAALAALALSFASPVVAQQADPPAAEKKADSSMGFEATTEVPKDNLPGWPFLYGAYTCIWVLLLGYVIFMWRKQSALTAQIGRVDKRLDELDRAIEALDGKS